MSDKPEFKASPNTVEHRPRTTAKGPGIKSKDLKPYSTQPSSARLSADDDASRASPSLKQGQGGYLYVDDEKRRGVKWIEYGCYAGASAVIYTYLRRVERAGHV